MNLHFGPYQSARLYTLIPPKINPGYYINIVLCTVSYPKIEWLLLFRQSISASAINYYLAEKNLLNPAFTDRKVVPFSVWVFF